MSNDVVTTVLVPAAAAWQGQQPYDLVSLAAVKNELAITVTSFDSNLLTWITNASSAAAKFCNRIFPVELLQDQIFPQRDPYPQIAIGGPRPLTLARWPLAVTQCLAGLAAPAAPVLAAVSGGALAAARYYARITYVTAQGETAVSAEANFVVTAGSLLQVTSPAADPQGLATGYNVYVSTASGTEVQQNSAPISIGAAWTMPPSGLVTAGTAMPSFVSVIENSIPLAEGVDFLVDATNGQLHRLTINGFIRHWPALAIVVLYPAGYVVTASTFADVVDAVTRMVKARYYAQTRDPAVRSENIPGAYEAQYWFASGPGAAVGDLTPDVSALLERYRVPVMG